MHRVEPFMSEPSASQVKVATGKLKLYKSLSVEQIPAELGRRGNISFGDS
jgi:hypothetical protein